MDISKLLNGFVNIDTWISLNCYMNLSKMIYGIFSVVAWICQSCYMDSLKLLYFSHFAKQNQVEV